MESTSKHFVLGSLTGLLCSKLCSLGNEELQDRVLCRGMLKTGKRRRDAAVYNGKCPCPWQGLELVAFEVLSNPSHAEMQWFHDLNCHPAGLWCDKHSLGQEMGIIFPFHHQGLAPLAPSPPPMSLSNPKTFLPHFLTCSPLFVPTFSLFPP